MHESDKIAEANYFHSQLSRGKDWATFKYNLSAFLSAARSVLQYALDEAAQRGGQNWYEAQIQGSEILRYFRDKRNTNVHKRPLTLRATTNITLSAGFNVAGAVSATV